jgi:hypothetical protein
MLALAAHDNGVPFFPVVPTSTIDLAMNGGIQIPIEERDPQEVLAIQVEGARVSPPGAAARNPAFDVTPNRLVTGVITEYGVVYPPCLNKGKGKEPFWRRRSFRNASGMDIVLTVDRLRTFSKFPHFKDHILPDSSSASASSGESAPPAIAANVAIRWPCWGAATPVRHCRGVTR